MKIAVIGGTGRVGDKVMTALADTGHQAVAASPAFGVDAFTGEGLDEVMVGVEVVIDVSNAPAWGDEYVLKFFSTVTRNLLKAGRRAGARHHVALSALGCDRLPESGYMRAKVAQEALTRQAQVPHTIVRSTQFMEFLAAWRTLVPRARWSASPTLRCSPSLPLMWQGSSPTSQRMSR